MEEYSLSHRDSPTSPSIKQRLLGGGFLGWFSVYPNLSLNCSSRGAEAVCRTVDRRQIGLIDQLYEAPCMTVIEPQDLQGALLL